jgi:hypothetical protein
MKITTTIELSKEDYGKQEITLYQREGDYLTEEEFLDYCLGLAKVMGYEDFEWVLARKYDGTVTGYPFQGDTPIEMLLRGL